jgi:iron complex transport system ATP-binding protein
MSGTLLAAEAVGYSIRGQSIVRDVCVTLRAGRMTVVIGPNGAGKSTLLRLLTGELAPSTGQVLLEGTPLAALPAWRLACRRAVMMQAARLAFPFTAHEVTALGASGVGRALRRDAVDDLAVKALTLADAAHLAGRAYQTLSGGEQQRVQFARALAQLEAGRSVEPRQILFLDEPVSSLDLKHQLALLDAAQALAAEGRAVLAVLHDINLALAYADDLVVMHGGRVAAQGAPAAVVTDAMLAEVFGVTLRLRATPPAGSPFLLPQTDRHPPERRLTPASDSRAVASA